MKKKKKKKNKWKSRNKRVIVREINKIGRNGNKRTTDIRGIMRMENIKNNYNKA